MSIDQVHHVPYTSAEEFLDAISPRSEHLSGAVDRWPHFFIFRGHANDKWELIPKALRLGERIYDPLGLSGWGCVKSVASDDGSDSLQERFVYEDGTLNPRLDRQRKTREPPRIEIVTAPGAGNPNLYAQRGLFTLMTSEEIAKVDRRPLDVDRRPLDEVLKYLTPSYELVHFTLPVGQASKLLSLLSHQGITGATVYPGYYGAAKAVLETRYF